MLGDSEHVQNSPRVFSEQPSGFLSHGGRDWELGHSGERWAGWAAWPGSDRSLYPSDEPSLQFRRNVFFPKRRELQVRQRVPGSVTQVWCPVSLDPWTLVP